MTLVDALLVILIALIFALVVESPLIYARFKNKDSWVPINSAPWMLGDDYYYFSVLNEFHKIIFIKKSKILKTPSLSVSVIFQFVGHFLNLIPYHLGYLLEDKRMGTLFVKLWNRMMLFISIIYFSTQIFDFLGYEPSFRKLIVIFFLFFIFYPGPISLLSFKRGIVLNVFNPKHMFNQVHANDLTRGMHSETTAPILIILTGVTLNIFSYNSEYLIFYIIIFSLILFFQYFPAFVVYSFFSVTLLIFLKLFIFAFILIIIFFILSLFYLKILSKCKVTNELIVHNDGGKIFNMKLSNLAEIVSVIIIVPLLVAYYNYDIITLLCLCSASFVLTHILFKHQISRFWERGATIIFQLLVIIMITDFLNKLNNNILDILLLSILAGLLIYFFKNSKYLYLIGSTKIPDKFNHNIITKIFDSKYCNLKIVTNSVELSYYINLYANNNCILKDFSIQNKGYKKHLKDICYNYKAIGYDLNKVIKILTTSSGDWRSLKKRENIPKNYPYFHEIQFITNNYIFNNKIIIDGMYVNQIWTYKYNKLIKKIWFSINKIKFNDAIIV